MTQQQKFRRDFSGDPERLEKMKEFIQSYWVKFHRSPNVREVRIALGGLSTSVISYYRDRLEHDGWLEVVAKPRAVCSFVPTEIFADRPVFPSLVTPEDLNDEDFYRTHDPDEQRVLGSKTLVSTKFPPITNADLVHMPMIHREKE